jgi:hypothetical protein
MGYELTNAVFERAKAFHALDRAATVISEQCSRMFVYIVTCLLKAGIAGTEKWPLLGNGSVNKFIPQPNHVTAATDTHSTIEELLEAEFSITFK